jgi:hypothetical protein
MAEPEKSPRASSDIPRSGDPDLKLESPSPISDSEDPERGIEPQSLPPNSADWNGPTDSENPLNWPTLKRYWHVVPPAVISFAA